MSETKCLMVGWSCFILSLFVDSAFPFGIPLTVSALVFWFAAYRMNKKAGQKFTA